MSNLDDSWLSTRNRTKIVPKKDVVKKRSSLPKPRKSSNCAAFPMTQNSPPPKLLHTATKQSKLSDFFKLGDNGPEKCLKEKRPATWVGPEEVSRRSNPDGSRSNKVDTSGINVEKPGFLSETAVYESKPCYYQGKENISNLNEMATNEHNMWKGCMHEAEKFVSFHDKYDTNSYNFDTTFSLQHPTHKFQDIQRNHASWVPEKHGQGVKRDISLDEIDKATVCKRHKKENTCNDTEILSKLDDDVIPSHRLQISNGLHPKAAEEKTAYEKPQEDLEDHQKNTSADEEMAGKLTDTMIDRDNLSSHDNSSLDLSVVDNSECSQGLLLETQLYSQIADDDDENTKLDLDNLGDSMGQSLELCTQFTLSSQ